MSKYAKHQTKYRLKSNKHDLPCCSCMTKNRSVSKALVRPRHGPSYPVRGAIRAGWKSRRPIRAGDPSRPIRNERPSKDHLSNDNRRLRDDHHHLRMTMSTHPMVIVNPSIKSIQATRPTLSMTPGEAHAESRCHAASSTSTALPRSCSLVCIAGQTGV